MVASWNREYSALISGFELHQILTAPYTPEDFTIAENPYNYDVDVHIDTGAHTHVFYDDQFASTSSDIYIASNAVGRPQGKSSNTRW